MARSYRPAEDGITRLYHYQKYEPDFLLITLKEQKIYCSNPATLNDPWDCRPRYDYKSLQDPDVFNQFNDWVEQEFSFLYPDRPKIRFVTSLRDDPEGLKRIIDSLSNGLQGAWGKRRIYCLTPDPRSILMWSHYADNHKGICLEFGTDNELFQRALNVIYRSEYPLWTPHQVAREGATDMILTKAADWSYENESRLIGTPDPSGSPLSLDGEYLRLPRGALKSIIAGCKANNDAISKLVLKHAPHLPVKRAVREENHYRLVIED